MAWSDAARRAAAETHKRRREMTYQPIATAGHINRGTMASYLREARSAELRGPGKSIKAVAFATNGSYTNVKGAHFVDQGLTGTAWRYLSSGKASKRGYPSKGMPKWAAKKFKFSNH